MLNSARNGRRSDHQQKMEAKTMGMTSHWTDDDDDNWHLLDRLLVAIRKDYHPPDEIQFALITCLAKTIAMMNSDSRDDGAQIEECARMLRSTVDFQRGACLYDR
jgi:hypothetical protein